MTLHDSVLVFRAFAAVFAIYTLLRVLYPFYQERTEQREADERRHAEADAYLDRVYKSVPPYH